MTMKYIAQHPATDTYIAGMTALVRGDLRIAADILSNEPVDSPCHGLALGNAALVMGQLGQHAAGDALRDRALNWTAENGCPHPPSFVQFLRNNAESIASQQGGVAALSGFARAVEVALKILALAEREQNHENQIAEIELERAHTLTIWGGTLFLLQELDEARTKLEEAVDIYDAHAAYSQHGHANALINLAAVLFSLGSLFAGKMSLDAAEDIATQRSENDMVDRIRQARQRYLPEDVSYETIYQTAVEISHAAFTGGRIEVAYIRLCSGAWLARQPEHVDLALDLVTRAGELEPLLASSARDPARLRLVHARLLAMKGCVPTETIPILLDGARRWYTHVIATLSRGSILTARELRVLTAEMHEHFCVLCWMLAVESRTEEAIVAFEVGRALGHAVAVDQTRISRDIDHNPFQALDHVDCTLLRKLQNSLQAEEAVVSIAMIHQTIAIFLVSREDVGSTYCVLPDPKELDELGSAIRSVPQSLAEDVGYAAIPPCLLEGAQWIAKRLGNRRLIALAPHGVLHDVPWRALLFESGIPCNRLAFGIEFGLLLRFISARDELLPVLSATALAHGSASSGEEQFDFADEAKNFVASFESRGTVIKSCTSHHFRAALSEYQIVMLSAHGKAEPQSKPLKVVFYLEDGEALPDDVFPEKVLAPIVVLSACDSGVYVSRSGDFPDGPIPALLRLGVRYCVGTRFPIRASFAAQFFPALGTSLAEGKAPRIAFAIALEACLAHADAWRDVACIELMCSP